MTISTGRNLSSICPSLGIFLLALFVLAPQARGQQAYGSITGRVTESSTNLPVSEMRISVVGTTIGTSTNAEGRFNLPRVPAGQASIRVLRVGYQQQVKPVTVTPGQNTTIDFVVVPAAVQLTEIVTTATGEQRKEEIGNAIATLGNVAQRVEQTATKNIADLMVAKAPGVVVLPAAMTGAAPVVRIRGIGSLATTGSGITNDPIYIIDGVRMNTGSLNLGTGGTRASLLNDLDPNEIQDIEIVKGPSAATLYGTDAANGVVVITTKRGRAGATQWTWFAEEGLVKDDNKYPASYALWGHTPGTSTYRRCTLVSESQGTCAVDSLTSFNVLTDPSTTPFHTGNRSWFGGQASGGSDRVRFFVSGDVQNELGPIHMPQFAQATLVDSLGIKMRDEWLNPEAFQSYSTRTNLSASLTPTVDLTMTAGYSNTNQRLPQVDNNINSFIYSARNNPGFNHNGVPGISYSELGSLGEFRNGYGVYSPAQIFQDLNTNDTQRLIGSADGQWRPFAWMQNQATMGIDLASNDHAQLCRFAECPDLGTQRLGTVSNNHATLRNFSARLISNSSWQARSNLILKTSLGADYTNLAVDTTFATGTQLPPGGQTVGEAAVRDASNAWQTVNKTLGLYLQEEFAFADRLFLTLAARTDQNSSFGTNFQRIVYPKASVSWLLSNEGFFPKMSWMDQLRLRGAYGASGVSPGGIVALRTFQAQTGNIAPIAGVTGGVDTPGLLANRIGNSNLKPERSAEFEGGFDADLYRSRAHFGFTYYDKKTHDALISQQIASSSGAPALSVLKNLASVENSGIEVDFNSTILDRQVLGWDVSISASHNSNKILSLGNDPSGKPNATIGTGTNRDSVGLPVNAAFARPYTYADKNQDGIITPDEVTVTPTYEYAGYSSPRDLFSVTNGIDFLNHKLRFTVLTDYKGGYVLFNSTGQFYAQNFSSWYSNSLKSTPLWDQARTVANSAAKNPTPSTHGYLENGQFWKLREVSAILTLPDAATARIRAHDAQLVFSARNLHTWTSYTGPDPEENYGTGDVQTDFSTLAPPRYFIVRLNLHY